MLPLGTEISTPNGPGTHIWHAEVAIGAVANHRIWTIADGAILILALWGIVKTTPCNASGGTTLRLAHNLGPVNLCGDLADCASDPVGTYYYMEGIQASLLVKAEGAVGPPTTTVAKLTPIPCVPGDIDLTVTGFANTGVVEWHMVYRCIGADATVVNAVYD